MKELMSFFTQNSGFTIAIVAVACILFGRVWSNYLNWGEITDPQLLIRKNKNYRVINLYLPKGWTEGWEVGSIICFEIHHRSFFVKYRREIYVSGDRVRFTDDGPGIGSLYTASISKTSGGSIVMTPVNLPSGSE